MMANSDLPTPLPTTADSVSGLHITTPNPSGHTIQHHGNVPSTHPPVLSTSSLNTSSSGSSDSDSDGDSPSTGLVLAIIVIIAVVAVVLLVITTAVAVHFYKKNSALQRQLPVFCDPVAVNNEAFNPLPNAESHYELASIEQRQVYDDANELHRASQAAEQHTSDHIEQPHAQSTYDEVSDALTFNVVGGLAVTLYNDGSNSLA